MIVPTVLALPPLLVRPLAPWRPSRNSPRPRCSVQDSWQSPQKWYDHGKAFYATQSGPINNIEGLHAVDIADSRRFLTAGEPPLWPAFREGARALDVGAGVGRVSGALLLDLCGRVDLVDGCEAFIERARASLGGESETSTAARGRAGSFRCTELQHFVPEPASYDLIWIQWTLMHLTDDDVRRLLADCRRALAPGGLLVLKENVIDAVVGSKALVDGRYLVDDEDSSVSRTRSHFLELVSGSGFAELAASADADFASEELAACLAENRWVAMHPVAMLALR